MTKRLTNAQIKKIEEMPVLVLQGELLGLIDEVKEKRKIEEELGIDLITLFKAYENYAYYKDEIIHYDMSCNYPLKEIGRETFITNGKLRAIFLDKETKRLVVALGKGHKRFDLKDYGKTWSLNEGDLK